MPSPVYVLRLPADCTIAAIRGAYDLIREALCQQHSLEIDCSSITKADITSIQLLLSAVKSGEVQGCPVVLKNFSEIFRNTLRRAGFSSEAVASHPFNEKRDDV